MGPDSVDEEDISEGKIKWHDRSFSGSWVKGRVNITYSFFPGLREFASAAMIKYRASHVL